MLGTGAGIAIQFPFPSLRYPSAHEIVEITEIGMHPPFPSEVKESGHFGEGVIVTGVSTVGSTGTHPPYPSVSNPSAQEIVEITEIGKQFPSPSLVYPDGQTVGSGVELGIQFPFPSLWNPDAQIPPKSKATQFPFPSLKNPLGQVGTEVGGD